MKLLNNYRKQKTVNTRNEDMNKQMEERIDNRISLIRWAIVAMLGITVGAIPWAMSIQSDVSSIRTKLDSLPDYFKEQFGRLEHDVDQNSERIRDLEKAIQRRE